MKPIYPTIFVLIFLGGVFFLFAKAKITGTGDSAKTAPAVSLESGPEQDKLPPLYLPAAFKGTPCPENSWEISGSVNTTFVSARAQLTAWLQNQSWKAAKEIQTGSNVYPKVLLTFERGDYEVIFQLARRDVNKTDFAYRREKKQTIGKGLTK